MARGGSATSQQSVQNAKNRLRSMLRLLKSRPTEILEEEARILKAEIIAEVPYRTGKLERSVKVSVAKDTKRPGINASAYALSPSGYNYAGIQHENAGFNHPVKGKDHFISDPFERCTDRIADRIIEEIDKELKA